MSILHWEGEGMMLILESILEDQFQVSAIGDIK